MVSLKMCVVFISNYSIMVLIILSSWRLTVVAMTVVPSSESEQMIDLLHGPAGALLVVVGWPLGGDMVSKLLRCADTVSNTLHWCRVLCIATFRYITVRSAQRTRSLHISRRGSAAPPPHWTSHGNVNLGYSVNTGFNGIYLFFYLFKNFTRTLYIQWTIMNYKVC